MMDNEETFPEIEVARLEAKEVSEEEGSGTLNFAVIANVRDPQYAFTLYQGQRARITPRATVGSNNRPNRWETLPGRGGCGAGGYPGTTAGEGTQYRGAREGCLVYIGGGFRGAWASDTQTITVTRPGDYYFIANDDHDRGDGRAGFSDNTGELWIKVVIS